ncbi:MAG: hypothetical protein IH944_00485 [Armatimonadetes bacterium]|nr:hypothetical protein [Armatimonadota bacterium]
MNLTPKKKKTLLIAASCFVVVAAVAGVFIKLRLDIPTQAEVNAAMRAGDYELLLTYFDRMDLDTDGGKNLYYKGIAHQKLGQSDEAIRAFMDADDADYLSAEVRYLVASEYAKIGEPELALNWLRDALEAGFTDLGRIEDAEDFAAVRRLSGFAALLSGDEQSAPGFDEDLSLLQGRWTASQNLRVDFVRRGDGAGIEERWAGIATGGARGVWLRDPATGDWNYRYIDGNGRVFRGVVQIAQHISIEGVLKLLDGTQRVRRIEIRLRDGNLEYSINDAQDEDAFIWFPTVTHILKPASSGSRVNF